MLGNSEKHLNTTFVKEAINKVYNYLNSQIVTIQDNGKNYSGFLLDISKTKAEKKIGIGSVSVGLSMYMYDDNNDRNKMEEMCNFIIDKQLTNGGWTVSELRNKGMALTYTTCYALTALILFDGTKYKSNIEKGIDWLFQNKVLNEGWGYKENDTSKIFATAEVLKLIQVAKNKFFTINSSYEETIIKAKSWLIGQKENQYWKYNNKPSLFFTSHCYKALINDNDYSISLQQTQKWLISNLNNAPCIERIQFMINSGDHTFRDQIECFTHSSIINSILSNKNMVYNKDIEEQMSILLTKKQTNLGYFSCKDEHNSVPIFLNYNIVDTLDLYTSYLLRRVKPNFTKYIIDNFAFFPIQITLASVLASIGFFAIIYNLKSVLANIPLLYTKMTGFFEKQSGLANFVTISGLSIAAFLPFLLKYLKKKRKDE